MKAAKAIALDRRFVVQSYRRFPAVLVKGRRTQVWDQAGRRYLDFLTGITEYYRARTDTKMTIAAERLAVIAAITLPVTAISSVVGLGGFMAYFTGGFVNEFTGQILQHTGSYVPVFAYFSLMYLLSLLLVHLLVPRIGRDEPAR